MVSNNNRLIEAIQNHKLVVIVDLPLVSLHSNELSKSKLTIELKKILSISSDLSFEQVIDFALRTQGKETFIPLLNRIMSRNSNRSPGYYNLFEKLGIKYVVDAHYSPIWRNEIIDNGMVGNYLFYNRYEDFSFSEDKQIIISLFGDTEYNKDKLIISQNDFNGFFANANSISPSLRSIFKSTILFVDFDPNSDRFKSIYDFICQQNGKYPSEAFLVSGTAAKQLAYGSDENLTIIQADAYDYINGLVSQLKSSIPILYTGDNDEKTLPQVPYKYLHSYEQNEYMIFFGREKEISELFLRVRGARQIAMLTALSGYGKTSMINAGLIPALKKTNDYDVYYIRSGNNPWKSIINEVFHKDPDTIMFDNLNIKQLSEKKYQLIIIDQFEECFVDSTVETLSEIDNRMMQLLHFFPTISLLISIRQDFFTCLTKFKFLNDAQINSTYNLEPLTYISAVEAIKRPTEFEEYKFFYEEGLVEQIVKDLSVEEDKTELYIDPSQLQIVCYFLYQELQNRKESVITAEIYNELGKANGILENYIDESLKKYDEKRQILGKEILKCLVSSKNTRVSKTSMEICLELLSNVEPKKEYSENDIKFMIERLVNARLVRTRTVSEGEQVYELTHEYIIRKINEWMDAETLRFKEVFELFRVEYRKWTLYKTIMPQNQYDEVWKYRNRINFMPQEKSYVLLCIISYANYDKEQLKYWIVQNKGNAFCDHDLTYAMNKFKGKKRMLSAVLLSILCPDDNSYNKIYDMLSENINPHLSAVEDEIKDLGESIDATFSKKMHELLNRARMSDMCVVLASSSVKLGLSAKLRDEIIKKHDIGNRMKPFFPERERTVSFSLFLIDKYTVTNKMYAEFDENYYYNEEQADYPVVGINFEQARAYAHWWGKDLPTEDEWEYAARGSDFRYFPWGNDWDYEAEKSKLESEKRCNTSLTGTDGARGAKEYPRGTSPCGCFNMSGNVWEWTKTDVVDDEKRVIVKGGSWSQQGIMPWTWYRYSYSKEVGYQNVGFRCVLRGEL
ncbi:Hercynine oxygenase [[Clostridium] scindens]|uniref:nSTAND1 domain-containing NTPase n=1 Tax=Clostridium scindens (strain JCM 10418 / VPI 12708) TaxID=29347 RepID=UPI0022F3A1C0|nr:SUMF1/EgtB/PvdO family nonheme iron enzyme [[Clostridium] scindens]WBX64599.1 Hercynine oxygenase [[Clostridium] scindens]